MSTLLFLKQWTWIKTEKFSNSFCLCWQSCSLGAHPAGSAFQRQHAVQPKTFPALSSLPTLNTNWIVSGAGFILHRHYSTVKSFQLDLQAASLTLLHCIDVKIWIHAGHSNDKNHYNKRVIRGVLFTFHR